MSAKIKKIEIKINDKVIALNVKEAKELKEILADMFNGTSIQREVIPVPYPVYVQGPYQYWWGTYRVSDYTATYTANTNVIPGQAPDTS